ncbi:hypothetical protein [Nocardia coubleae]|uniref:Uncharacterized protein n=1 Tax=Nocardia coubleae TaxID=356147 RepID=A0A846WAM1_9NOCA|nr:hypothetical protein [Nocardia coubleae]NKX89873.1 hypothetical protein [Nocardia coubleae]
MVLTEVADSLDQVRAALRNAIGRLAGAVNSDFTFRPGQGALTCSTAGCTVRQPFTGRITRSDRARVTGTATVTLTATVSVEGRHGGRCSASGSFPFDTTGFDGELTCSAPEAGAVFAAVNAEKQAAAERQAQAERRNVSYETRFEADTEAIAEAVGRAQVQGLLDAIEEGLREPDCGAAGSPCSAAEGQRPVPEAVRQAVEQLRNGGLPQRLDADGTPIVYEGNPDTSFADLLEWENSTIHGVPGMATTYRLLRNPDGDIGWTDTHNGRIMPYR